MLQLKSRLIKMHKKASSHRNKVKSFHQDLHYRSSQRGTISILCKKKIIIAPGYYSSKYGTFYSVASDLIKIAKKVPFAVRNVPIKSAKWYFLCSWTVLLSKARKRYL